MAGAYHREWKMSKTVSRNNLCRRLLMAAMFGCKRLKVAQVRSWGNRINAGIEPVRGVIVNWWKNSPILPPLKWLVLYENSNSSSLDQISYKRNKENSSILVEDTSHFNNINTSLLAQICQFFDGLLDISVVVSNIHLLAQFSLYAIPQVSTRPR